MGLADILEKIESEAKQEIAKIEAEATAATNKIAEEAQAEAEKQKQHILQTELAKIEAEVKKVTAFVALECRAHLLETKVAEAEKTFRLAYEQLLNLGLEEYRSLLKNLMLKAVESGTEEVILSEKDRTRLGEEFLAKINAELAERGKLRLSNVNRNISGGFLLRQGAKQVDCSFETIFKFAKEELEGKVASILFKFED